MPEMHTGWMEAGSAMFVISPEAESEIIEDHFVKMMGGWPIQMVGAGIM